ncbi:MAG: hypothetical protein LBF75_02110 [Treponema sp.]|nr:hypothetical protein [Treponema sp.]
MVKAMEKMQIQHSNPEGKAFICSRRRALTWFMMIERTGVKRLLCRGAVRRAKAQGIT